MSFVRAANPIWYFPDLIGEPLNDEYYAFFLTNTLPYLPQNIYRDPQGMTVWPGNKIEFFPNGTLPDNLYFDPNLVYRIEVRHGSSQSDQLIYEINNFVPGESSNPDSNSLAIFGNENQISNSQFSLINFNSPLTITTAGTYNIAPGWSLILTGSGSGTTIVTQLVLSGNQFPDNPPPPFPYALNINNSGWTSVILQQTFQNNGALWSLGAITGSIEGRALVSNETISMNYVPSNSSTSPGEPTAIFSGILSLGDYQTLSGAVDVNYTGNTNLGKNAFVNIQIILPPNGTIELTNIQIIGQTDQLPDNFDPATNIPSYQQETDDRMIDHLFHYYKNNLLIKPKKSLLTAWNFPQNPYQFINPTLATVVNQCQYVADQTILYQNAASQLQTGQNTIDNRSNFLVKAVAAAGSTRFALIQYIDPNTVLPYWSYVLSAFLRARIFTVNNTSVRLKCRLIYRTTLPSTLGNAEPIASWPANSDPIFSTGWTALSPLNDIFYVLPNAYDNSETPNANAYPGFSFDQFQLPNASAATMTLGIVFYTMDNLNSTADSEDSIAFDRASLIPSFFGADSEAQNTDEVFRECQYYYEKSYVPGTIAGASTSVGSKIFSAPILTEQAGSNPYYVPENSFNLIYNQVKRSIPILTLYSPDGTINVIRMGMWNGTSYPMSAISGVPNPENVPISQWSTISSTTLGIYFQPAFSTPILRFSESAVNLAGQGEMVFQYVADSRLGI